MDAPTANPPDWANCQFELACPLCRYNLRGLTDPRCPECGYRFNWDELIRAREQQHPYVFDAAERIRITNILRTFFASFRPSRFWANLQPYHTLRNWRLIAYLLFLWLPLLGFAGTWVGTNAVPDWVQSWQDYSKYRDASKALMSKINANPQVRASIIKSWGSVEKYVWRVCAPPPRPGTNWRAKLPGQFTAELIAACSMFCFLPALLIFQWSMFSRNIRWLHVLRCVAYSSQFVWVLGMVVAALAIAEWSMHSPEISILYVMAPTGEGFNVQTSLSIATLHFGMPLVILLTGWPLFQAYCRYMRFDHTLATVLSAQGIVLLVWMVVVYRAWEQSHW